MKLETLEQILQVVTVAAQRYSLGYGIDHAYQHGVSRVSQEYGIAYQTVGDACRRRLGLNHIGEFKKMLKMAFDGDPSDLRDLLTHKTSQFHHDRIDEFFSKLRNKEYRATNEIKEKKAESYVTYTVQLGKGDSDVLRALAQLLDDEPEKIIVEIAAEGIKERMKKVVNQL